jgi:hypothetical protein
MLSMLSSQCLLGFCQSVLMTDEHPIFYIYITGSWKHTSPSSCEVEVQLFTVGLQASNLQCYFVQAKSAYKMAILSQHNDYIVTTVPFTWEAAKFCLA